MQFRRGVGQRSKIPEHCRRHSAGAGHVQQLVGLLRGKRFLRRAGYAWIVVG